MPELAPIWAQLAPACRFAHTAARTSCPARSGTRATDALCHPAQPHRDGSS
ncbi:hypothetical protein ACN6LA_006050 [Streptomyces sp. SAS_269]|uniref:hypothetical protein n=1 Tax=Streptomyces sp. SAS_269 TaxID=3412749 RepID=UPI00403C45CC